MDEKDKRIAELESQVSSLAEKNANLEAEKKKKKKRDKTKFALQNLDYFRPILDTIKKQERYVFVRKGNEQVIKINEFISDLLVAKIKLGGSVPDKQIGTRLSMDEHSLIKFLSKDRATKEGAGWSRAGTKKSTNEVSSFKAIAEPKPIAQPAQPAHPDFTTMGVEDVFAYATQNASRGQPQLVRVALFRQLAKHNASDRNEELWRLFGITRQDYESDLASVT